MEDLFREILAPSPTIATTSLPHGTGLSQYEISVASETTASTPEMNLDETLGGLSQSVGTVGMGGMNWTSEAEMQRILDMLPNTTEGEGYPVAPSEMDLGWELDDFGSAVGLGMVGVF
jgi:hypothetical protein